MFSQFFKKRKISHPRYPTHLYHVSIGETGELIGLPKEWTLEAPHAFRKHPIAKTNPQTQSPEQQNPPPPEPHPPPISRSPPLPQSPLIHPKSILGRIGKSSSAPTSTVKSHHALSQQKEKENNVFSEWIDKAVSNNYLKLHKYGVFSDTKEIGSGSFGTVYCAYNIQYAKYMVLKSLKINNKFTTEQMLKQIVNELQQHRQVEMHDNVIGFYALGEYMLVMEYANNGTLHQYLSKNFSKMDWNIKLNHKVFNGGRENIIPGTPKIYVDIYKACWHANPIKRPKMSQVVKLLDKVDINDPIQVVDDVPSPDLTTNINDPSSNSTENQIVGSKTYLFEITSTMERRLYEE
ncbi:12731_t:CDS:2 [Entrophospora sp. SA101]|nr:12731_t:CDS:2 [Entrophospora sp. SA101]